MADAPPLFHARDARQDLLRDDRGIRDRIQLLQAPVAGAALRASIRLAEVLHERAVAAPCAGRVALHVAQERAAAVGQLAVHLEHLPPADEVGARINEHALSRQPVAARASRFLLVVLGRSRRARVHHEAHVRAIDPHPERDGGDHDVDALVEERFLIPAAHIVGQPGVVRRRPQAFSLQPDGQRLDFTARSAIDNAGLARVAFENLQKLAMEIAAAQDAVGQVRPVERTDEDRRILQTQLGNNVAADALGRGRRERVQRHVGKIVAQAAELPVLGTKIVAPLADAVRFVDGDEPHAGLLQHAAKPLAPLAHQPLRRHVQQTALVVAQARQHRVAFVGCQRAVQIRGRHAVDAQAVDLILHQRNQRRDDQGEAESLRPVRRDAPCARRVRRETHERRRLETQRLPAAGRQHDDAVASGEDGLHRFALQRTEARESPHALQGRLEPLISV